MSEQAIEFLGWLPMSERLRTTMVRASELAAEAREAEMTIEHLLRAFDEDVDVNVYLARCGVEGESIAALFRSEENCSEPAEREPGGFGDARAGWRERETVSSGLWERREEGSYSDYSDRVSDGFGAYGAASSARSHPQPGRALRRLMARACQTAENLGCEEISSELALQVLALDESEETGRRLAALLPEDERARLCQALAAPKASQDAAAGGEVSFKALASQIETLLMSLHGELQKDMRYRIANDLAAFITQTRPGEEGLQNSAMPILHATRAELERDPHFMAMERIRGALRSIRSEEGQIRAALGGLARQGRLEPGGALAEAAGRLVELPAPQAFEAQAPMGASMEPASPSTLEMSLPDEGGFAPDPLPIEGPALVHAARAGASPWEGLQQPERSFEGYSQEEGDVTGPAAGVEEERSEDGAPLLGRMFRSVRPRSMFSRRRSGAA